MEADHYARLLSTMHTQTPFSYLSWEERDQKKRAQHLLLKSNPTTHNPQPKLSTHLGLSEGASMKRLTVSATACIRSQ